MCEKRLFFLLFMKINEYYGCFFGFHADHHLPDKKLALVGRVIWQSSVGEFVAQSSFIVEGYDLEIKPSKMVFHDGHIYALIVKNAAQGVPLRVVRFHLE